MYSLASTSESTEFTVVDPTTGIPTDADSTPTATLRRNESASGVTVTVTNLGTGEYRASWTNGAWTAGDRLTLKISATVGGDTYKETIWEAKVDVTASSRLAPTTAGRTIDIDANNNAEATVIGWNGVALSTTNPLPNAAPDAAGGLPISDAGGLDLDAKLANTNEITTARMGALTDWINGGRLDLLLDALLDRLTETRAGYLDNLNGHIPQTGDTYGALPANFSDLAITPTEGKVTVGTNDDKTGYALSTSGVTAVQSGLATSSEVTSIQNNTRVVRVVPSVIERPDSGTQTYRIELLLYDSVGNMEAPDSAPILDLVNQAGTDLSSRLDSAVGTLVSTGRYRWVYTATNTDTLEQLLWTFSVTENTAERLYGNNSVIVDTTAVDFTSADRTKLEAIHGKLPTRDYLAGSTNSSGALVEADLTNLDQSLSQTESNIRGADSDTLKTVSDQIDAKASETNATSNKNEILTAVAGIEGGSGGANTVTITVTDGSNPIPNAEVLLKSGVSLIDNQDTNGSGVATLTANNGTYTLVVSVPSGGYSSSTNASFSVSGATSTTVSLTALSITPSNPGFVTGYVTCYDASGSVESGVVISLQLVDLPSASTGVSLDSAVRVATSNVSGIAQFTGLLPGATYKTWRGDKLYFVTTEIASGASGSVALASFYGVDS